MRWLIVVGMLLGPELAAAACDTGSPSADCDEDGFTVTDGDCDDENAEVHPEQSEDCETLDDDDCNGLFNDGCAQDQARATLRGGSSCAQPTAAWLFIALPFWRRRRGAAC